MPENLALAHYSMTADECEILIFGDIGVEDTDLLHLPGKAILPFPAEGPLDVRSHIFLL